MRLVLAALSRPLAVIVALIAILTGFALSLGQMRTDIFPEVGNPVIYVAQPYGGMTPAQMEGFLTYYYEYHFLYITGIHASRYCTAIHHPLRSRKRSRGSAALHQFHPHTRRTSKLRPQSGEAVV